MPNALIVWGGWDGHQPDKMAKLFQDLLEAAGYIVQVADNLEVFAEPEPLKALDLIVPIWTMGELETQYVESISQAVARGVGFAGCHGGMCDAFRGNLLWAFMTGGTWIAHPGGDGVDYTVHIRNSCTALTEGIADFQVCSEQYYLHVDPAVEVLATTRFPTVTWYHTANGQIDMPVVWTKRWGHGRVYYNSLGHQAEIMDIAEARELMRRGMLWAAEGKQVAQAQGLDPAEYENPAKMF